MLTKDKLQKLIKELENKLKKTIVMIKNNRNEYEVYRKESSEEAEKRKIDFEEKEQQLKDNKINLEKQIQNYTKQLNSVYYGSSSSILNAGAITTAFECDRCCDAELTEDLCYAGDCFDLTC